MRKEIAGADVVTNVVPVVGEFKGNSKRSVIDI
jgi:hypothetical protein